MGLVPRKEIVNMSSIISPEERARRLNEEAEYAAQRRLRWLEICATEQAERRAQREAAA